MVENKDKTPVAQNVITMCTKCKMELNHVVVSHNKDGIVAKVKCHTCGSEHKYQPEKKKAAKKSPVTRKKSSRTKKLDYAEEFAKLAETFRGKKPVPYSMSGSFKKDDLIDHKTFGKGFVTNVSYQKIDVLFSDGFRLLASERENLG
jgi:hypothetical protein